MDARDLAFAGAAAQAQLLADGTLRAPELLEVYLERIARLDNQLGCYRVVRTDSADTLADGVATRIPDAAAFGLIRRGAARIVTVTDEEVAAAIHAYWQDTHNLAEGAGAAPLAALLRERERMAGRRVGLVLTGGNIDLDLFRRWVLGAGGA